MAFRQSLTRALADIIFLIKKKQLTDSRLKFLAFTGTVGKTTTRDAVAFALQKFGKRVYTSETGYTNELGVILTALGLKNFSFKSFRSWRELISVKISSDVFACVELGADFYSDIPWFLKKFRPFAVFITSCADVAWSADVNAVMGGRQRLLETIPDFGAVMYSSDDAPSSALITKAAIRAKILDFRLMEDKAKLIKFPFPIFAPQIRALAAALELTRFLGIADDNLFEGFTFSKNRLKTYHAKNGALIIEDIYKATPLCTKWFLSMMAKAEANRKILVLTEMRPVKFNIELHYRTIFQAATAANQAYFLGPKKIYRDYARDKQTILIADKTKFQSLAREILAQTKAGDIIFLVLQTFLWVR